MAYPDSFDYLFLKTILSILAWSENLCNKNLAHIKIYYQGVKYVGEYDHQNKLDRCINPDEPALHWKTKLKLGFAYVSETQPNINKISKKKRYHE